MSIVKAVLKIAAALVLVILLGAAVIYSYQIFQARNYTTATILPDLAAGKWRNFKGASQAFEMTNEDLSARQREILIKVQDPGFHQYNGIDLFTPGAGLTTITQAITKKLYFEKFKPGLAKIYQSLVARFVVDDLISKEDQLSIFLNAMYYGRKDGKPVIELNAAAHTYYAVPVRQLEEDQFISLIAMLVMPNTFHVMGNPEWNRDRSKRIKAMVDGHYQPQGLMDQFYGKLPQDVVDAGLPPASYFKNSLQPEAK